MIGRIGPVTQVQYTGAVNDINVYRSPYVPSIQTNALTVDATSLSLPATVGTTLARGVYLNTATAPGARRRPGGGGRPATGGRPDLAGPAHHGRQPVVLPGRHPQSRRAGPRD